MLRKILGFRKPFVIGQNDPANPSTILDPRDQEIGLTYVVQKRRATDFEAPKL